MSKKPSEVIVAIDPSLSNTAIVIGSTNEPSITAMSAGPCVHGVAGRITRYGQFADEIDDYIHWATELSTVRAIYIEAYSCGVRSNPSGMAALCEFGALLRSRLLGITDRIFEVAPATLKKFATDVPLPRGTPEVCEP